MYLSPVSNLRRGSAYLTISVQLSPPLSDTCVEATDEVKSFVGALTGPPIRPSLSTIRQLYFNRNPSGARLQNANYSPYFLPPPPTHTLVTHHSSHSPPLGTEDTSIPSRWRLNRSLLDRIPLMLSLSLSLSLSTHAGSPCNYCTRATSLLRVRFPSLENHKYDLTPVDRLTRRFKINPRSPD